MICERSSPVSFEVAWRSTARDKSSGAMPEPSSATRISPSPPPAIATLMRGARASIAFSISSLTTLAGRSTTSPAAMRLTRSGDSCRTGILGLCLFAGEIPAGQDFTRFYRRLVERVDAEEMRGKDGFEHEMHHQRAERTLIQRVEIDGAHRPACIGQRLGNGALLCHDEVASGVASQIIGAGQLCE